MVDYHSCVWRIAIFNIFILDLLVALRLLAFLFPRLRSLLLPLSYPPPPPLFTSSALTNAPSCVRQFAHNCYSWSSLLVRPPHLAARNVFGIIELGGSIITCAADCCNGWIYSDRPRQASPIDQTESGKTLDLRIYVSVCVCVCVFVYVCACGCLFGMPSVVMECNRM